MNAMDMVVSMFPWVAYTTMTILLLRALWLAAATGDAMRMIGLVKRGRLPVVAISAPSRGGSHIARTLMRLEVLEAAAPVLGLTFTVGGILVAFNSIGASADIMKVLPAALGTTVLGAVTLVICTTSRIKLAGARNRVEDLAQESHARTTTQTDCGNSDSESNVLSARKNDKHSRSNTGVPGGPGWESVR